MQFISHIVGYIAMVRDEQRQYFPDGNYRVLRPALFADFAEEAVDETYHGQEGESDYVAMRGGGFFDSEAAAKRHGWTEEEHEAVVERLLEIVKDGSGDVRVYEVAKPTPPWNTYDEQHPDAIVATATVTGMAQAALSYEERTEKREELMEGLRELVAEQNAESELTAA